MIAVMYRLQQHGRRGQRIVTRHPESEIVISIYLYINNSLQLARKYVRIFVRGHYLFRVANSFPRA